MDDLKSKLNQGRRKAGPAGISPSMFADCVTILKGYRAVDDVLEQCERIGSDLKSIVDSWTTHHSRAGGSQPEGDGDDVVSLTDLSSVVAKGFIRRQPATLSSTVSLKEYQLIGLNWLKLLYSKKYSCILADEMGALLAILS